LGAKIRSVDLLGSDAKITFEQREDGLHIHLPEHGPGKYAYAFRIVFD
jgi:alpha-L-fucosidase